MEGLAPTLRLCLEMRIALECGVPVMSAIRGILPQMDSQWRHLLTKMIYEYERTGRLNTKSAMDAGLYRGALLLTLAHGLNGEPILSRLRELEPEIRLVCHEEIEKYIASLPIKTLVPLLLIQFPAFLLLLLGPMLDVLTKGLSG